MPAGHSLICEVCSSRNATMCDGEMMACDASMDTCEHSIIRSNAYGKMLMVFKGCATACKDLYITETITTGRTTIQRVCCDSDYCNNDQMEIPAREDKPNGVSCPSYLHVGSYECGLVRMLQCTDSETSCIYFRGLVDPSGAQPVKTIFLGCVNLEECDPFPEIPGGLITEIEDVSCTKG
ncbi:phospholipase A2 inhibitor and Ly6/PLAUR domain-containing protein-like isoform X2 [Pleurodeles waltl]|uniref:phospholipase A2 inhibitor and Ly6/PLAUR domain-containing protein-like isoform X2 n=1 Tax=Pleurodeles waltl TaxID=8319 RepID=UPI0037099B19